MPTPTAQARYAQASLDQLRGAHAQAQRATAAHMERGTFHMADLCRARAAELAGEILVRSDHL